MREKQTVIRTLLFLFLLTLVSCIMYVGTCSISRERLEMQQGYADLSGFNLDQKLAILPASSFIYYPNILHTPETIPDSLPSGNEVTQEPARCGTYRMILELPAGKAYSIRAYSALHSQRLFVNSEELSVLGHPGTTADTTVPETGYYTVHFTPETDRTEILIQTAAFHYGHSGLYDLVLGTAENIRMRTESVQTRIHMIEGGLVSSLLLSAGLYLFFKRRANLWFSLACVAVFIRIVVMEENNFLNFCFPLSWEVSVELKYLSTVALGFFFVMFIKDSFPGVLHCALLTAFSVGCLLTTLTIIFTSVVFYSRVIFLSFWGSWLFLIYAAFVLTLHMIRRKRTLRIDQVLSFTEFLVFAVCFLFDLHLYRHGAYNMSMGLIDLGTVICIHINTIVPIIDYAHTSMERDKVQLAEQEIRETNLLLDRLNRMRTEFLQNLSHELRTPLTVISNCAGLTALQLQRNAQDEDTLENMEIIKREAGRLGSLVEQIKKISINKDWRLTLIETDIRSLLQRTADFCDPICRKNDNIIAIEAEGLATVQVNADSIFQVLLNLVINANRHTKQDTILLKAQMLPSGDARISVVDHGEGIPTHLMPRIYERHVSGDGGSGLGLPICKEIIEKHGGTLEIQSSPGQGTTIHVNIPNRKEEADYEDDPVN